MKKKRKPLLITRLAFCPECAKEKRPKSDDYYLAVGFPSGVSHVKKAQHKGIDGYTPHLFYFVEIVSKVVFYEQVCSMNKCGSKFVQKNDRNYLIVPASSWSKTKMMSIKSWKALFKFKDTGFNI